MVLFEFEERLDVGVPWFEVNRETPVAFPALVDVARRVIEHAEHRHQPVGSAGRAADEAARRANIVDVQSHPARVFGDDGAFFERVEDALDAVALHAHEVARAELGSRRAGIEQRGGRVREIFQRHEIVRAANALEHHRVLGGVLGGVLVGGWGVYPQRYTHPHMLRAFDDCAARSAHEVGAFERFEPEVVDVVVARIVDHGVYGAAVFADEPVERVGYERHVASSRVAERVQPARHVAVAVTGCLVVVGYNDVTCEREVVGVGGGHCGALFRREFVYFRGANAVVQLVDDFYREGGVINGGDPRFRADVLDAVQDLIERDDLGGSVAL